jgi:hypothetical protein
MEGDPDDLLTRKRQHMDPVVQRLAPGFGAIWSVTAKTGNGIITVNLWNSPEGAMRFAQEPEASRPSRLQVCPSQQPSSALPKLTTRLTSRLTCPNEVQTWNS